MSLRNLFLTFTALFLLGCNENSFKKNKFEGLTEDEKDSLATVYHLFSKRFYQPSEIHRRFKDTALLIKPDHVEYRQLLSYSYKKRGEHVKAMKVLNEAVTRDLANGNTFALQYRAWSLLYYYRDYNGTIEDVNLINKMENGTEYTTCHGEPCNLLKGQALYKLGKYEEAIVVLQNLLTLEEKMGWEPLDNFLAYFYMARSFSGLKKYEDAIAIYKKQLHVYPEFTEAAFQIGKIFNELDEPVKARKYLNMAKTLLANGYKFGEPYFERFDEVFAYQIEEEIEKTLQK